MEKKQEKRNAGVYVAVFLTIIAALLDTFIGVMCGWPMYVYWVVWIQMLIIIVMTFWTRVPLRVQAVLFATFTCVTVFLSGLYFNNYFLEILMFSGTLTLVSFYSDRFLILYQMVIIIIAISLHQFVFKDVDFFNQEDALSLSMAIFLMLGIGLSLYINILREEYARDVLRETANKAERAEHSKSEFLANMSHEIRTPMNAIIGMCELALRERNVSQNVREYCIQIQNSGRSLLSIINDVLDFSKIESGLLELIEDEVNLASTLNDVINMTMTRMGDKNLELIVHVDTDIPKGVIVDETRLKQIMINLLTNAVKYTPEGVITLRVSKIDRDYGINLNVSVEDTGIGIKEENLEKLFSSFQQVDSKKNRSVEGTGLGLVITKRLLNSMGGFIKVRSEYGKGSVFSFVVPLRVSNREPFICVKDADNIRAVTYIDINKYVHPGIKAQYEVFLEEIGDSLGVSNTMCYSFEELSDKIANGDVTHCFIAKEEFIANKNYYESIADKIRVTLIQSRRGAVEFPSNIKCIFKPAYELPLAGIFNNESMIIDIHTSKANSITFMAPKARILIVDDNLINLEVAVGLMQPYKMQILTVESGKEAIRVLNSKDFDLVFMDHMMPEMDGIEATGIIRRREDEYYKKLPIIALTANAVGGAREMFMNSGFNGFLAKPIELSALDRILKQFLPSELIVKQVVSADGKKSRADANDTRLNIAEDTARLIDVETGMFYTGGTKETYLSILEHFVKKGTDKINNIKDFYDAKDWKNYVIEVHALKSSSLSLGAKDLSAFAKKLEIAGKAGDYSTIEDNQDKLISLFEDVIEAGRIIINENVQEDNQETSDTDTSNEKQSIERQELVRLLEELKTACDSFDSEAIENIGQKLTNKTFEDIEIDKYAKQIKNAAEDFDYDKARILCGKLKTVVEEED